MSNDFNNAIRRHLEQRAQEDALFAEKFNARMAADKNSILQCCSYIIQEVKKMKRDALTDSEVYGMAAHFFDEDIKVTSNIKCRVVVSRSDLTTEEMEGIKADAREAVRREVLEEEMKAAPVMNLPLLRKEGEEMHHCVYRMKYDKKNSLILSVRDRTRKKKRIATVEVGLDKFVILQCRGFNNSTPPLYEKICEAVRGSMDAIRRCTNE